jgi:hypothetical protein
MATKIGTILNSEEEQKINDFIDDPNTFFCVIKFERIKDKKTEENEPTGNINISLISTHVADIPIKKYNNISFLFHEENDPQIVRLEHQEKSPCFFHNVVGYGYNTHAVIPSVPERMRIYAKLKADRYLNVTMFYNLLSNLEKEDKEEDNKEAPVSSN